MSQIFIDLKLGIQRVHVDTTNFSVHGTYDKSTEDSTISIVKGHPKDGRWELNRFGIGVIVNEIGIPLFMQMLSGNEADKASLPDMIQRFRSQVDLSDRLHCVADSALYTEKNIKKLSDGVFFITLVPGTIQEQQDLLGQDLALTQMKDPRYSYYETKSTYGGVQQKWVVFHSDDQQRNAEKTLEKRRATEEEKVTRALVHLKNRTFACEKDAITEAERWIKMYPQYQFDSFEIVTTKERKNGARGRPARGEEMLTVFSIASNIRLKDTAWVKEQYALGRFVLATNDLVIAAEDLLSGYKEQGFAERGFRFLNDKSFAISDVFLKKIGRIEALGMSMILMLAVYSIGEYQLRKRLEELNRSVLNQLGKPTSKPTLKWVLTFFDGVVEFYRHDPVTDSVYFEGLCQRRF